MASDRSSSLPVASRKQPLQARSKALLDAVLEAAVQVLAEQGARRFTTARVAERAGVSVGSLYQYFPNKAAILFHLQHAEWRRTSALLAAILEDPSVEPLVRLRRLVHAFLASECEEAAVRSALHDAAPLYRDAPEAIEARREAARIFDRFVAAAIPAAAPEGQALAADLIRTTLRHVGSGFSDTPRRPDEIATYAEALADMLCAYLERLMAPAARAACTARASASDSLPSGKSSDKLAQSSGRP